MSFINYIPSELIEEIVLYLDNDTLKIFISTFPQFFHSLNWSRLTDVRVNNVKILDYFDYHLILSLLKIRSMFPARLEFPSIQTLYNLNSLDLSSIKLYTLPNEICELINLQHLAISDNVLTNLPKHFYKLKNLIDLDAIANRFTKIPKQIFHLYKLKALYLTNNEIDEIPDEISNLEDLEELYMGENKLTKISLEFMKLKKIKVFSTINNDLDEGYINAFTNLS